jgi:hypothetical protein
MDVSVIVRDRPEEVNHRQFADSKEGRWDGVLPRSIYPCGGKPADKNKPQAEPLTGKST